MWNYCVIWCGHLRGLGKPQIQNTYRNIVSSIFKKIILNCNFCSFLNFSLPWISKHFFLAFLYNAVLFSVFWHCFSLSLKCLGSLGFCSQSLLSIYILLGKTSTGPRPSTTVYHQITLIPDLF